ncbi:MAG: aldose 1-epimerase family protein [Bacteroidota bacterium]
MPSLSNAHLAISVNDKGAELSSVQHQQHKIEYIWQANPDVWGRHAPMLFPIVGKLKDNQYQIDGNSFEMKQHGFARDRQFQLLNSGKDFLHFRLVSDEQTRALYPFDFELNVFYKLVDNLVQIMYQVVNKSEVDMAFSIGAHPGFKVPMTAGGNYEDYEIHFEQKESLSRYLLDGGLYTGETELVLDNSHSLPLTRQLFDKDALVFHHPESSYIRLQSSEHSHSVRMGIRGFAYLGIWAKPGADFVCLEPWQGLADYTDTKGDLRMKKGIMTLAPHQIHYFNYDLLFN